MSELVFAKDGITIRTHVTTPLVGETLHEEKLAYDKLPVNGIQITITSINPSFDNSGSLKTLSFGVKDIISAPNGPTTKDKVETALTPGSLRHHYLALNPVIRPFFPGYKVPFIITDGVKQYSVHVSSAEAGTQIGAPDRGLQVTGGLKDLFSRHHWKAGDKLLITAIEPNKLYRIARL